LTRLITKTREWAEPVQVAAAWRKAGRLVRHRPYFFYSDAELFPCDDRGYRRPEPYRDITEKYAALAPDAKPIFCYGGSTTFGVYGSYGESYPAVVEALTGRPTFNMGLQSFDAYAAALSFIDHLRAGLIPATVVFLDGVNEGEGFAQAGDGANPAYRETFRQYRGFEDLVKNASLKYRLRTWLRRGAPEASGPSADPMRFVADHAEHYRKTQVLVTRLCGAYGIRPVFLLQPSVWDIWSGGSDPRHAYLKGLYARISEIAGPATVDISKKCPLSPEMFYDWAHLSAEGNRLLGRCVVEQGALDAD